MKRTWAERAAWLCLAVASLASSGCYRATFVDPRAYAGDEHEEWTDFYVFGLVNTEEIDVRSFCQGPVARVRTGSNAGTTVVSLLTIGIYTPRKVYVTCASGREVAVQAKPETEARP